MRAEPEFDARDRAAATAAFEYVQDERDAALIEVGRSASELMQL